MKKPTLDEVADFLSGRGSPEARLRVADALKSEGSELRRFLDAIGQSAEGYSRSMRSGPGAGTAPITWEDNAVAQPSGIGTARADQRVEAGDGRGESLQAAREQAALSRPSLIDRILRIRPGIELTEAILEAIESGKRRLDPMLAGLFAKVLEIPLARLLNPRPQTTGVQFLREPSPERPGPSVPAGGSSTKDVERELMDFLPAPQACEMLAAWKGGAGDLDRWLEDYTSRAQSDAFAETLTRVLICISLRKSHGEATTMVNRLVDLAGDDTRRLVDALYLKGRQRWYINAVESAIECLRRASDLAREFDDVREAQCLIYLSRLALDYPNVLPDSPKPWIDEAIRLGVLLGRKDIELLARRAEIIRLQKAKNLDAAMILARSILDDAERFGGLGDESEHIFDHVRIELGMALRKTYSEAAREEAERIYERGIARGRADSHAGMCHYLMADLYVDRMLEELRTASQNRDEGEILSRLDAAEVHRTRALDLCERSHQILRDMQDLAALQKVNRRLVFLRNMSLDLPGAHQEAADEHALRTQYSSHLFLGMPLASEKGAYSPAIVPKVDRDQLERLLGEFFSGMYIRPRPMPETTPNLRLDDYLRPGSLLCVPWPVGDSLVVRVFGQSLGAEKIDNVGWFIVDEYVTRLQSYIEQFLGMDEEDFAACRGEIFDDIQDCVQTIDSLGPPRLNPENPPSNIVVLAPRSNMDWICPVEWLTTEDPHRKRPTRPLVQIATDSLVFATSLRSPFGGARLQVSPECFRIFASTQALGDESVYRFVADRFGEDVSSFDVEEDLDRSARVVENEGVMIFAHSDRRGELATQLDRWEFPNARAVILLFCSSGHYQLANGPFVDGIALKIRDKLPEEGIVVGSRVPVEPEEAVRLAVELFSEANRFQPIATIITRYLQKSGEKNNPFQVPWVTLS